MVSLVILLCAAGCNQVWGIEATTYRYDAAIDAPRLFVPPDHGTACGAPPAFDSWHFAPHVISDAAGVIHPAFLADDRVVFMYQQHLFEAGVDSGTRRLTELELFTTDAFAAPSAGPTPDVFWFLRLDPSEGGIYVAVRGPDGWTQQRADLGVQAFQIQPGSVGFYGGTARMVISLQATSSQISRLVELSTTDGLQWTQVGELPFDSTVSRYDPALSHDGCFLLFSVYSDASEIFLSARGADGVFQPPVRLALSDAGSSVQPTLAPSMTKLWVIQNGGIVEGTP